MSPHVIDYTQLPQYKKLFKLGLREITGPRQKKTGTIKFSSPQKTGFRDSTYEYIWYNHGKVSRLNMGSNQYIAWLPPVAERSKEDYIKAFNAIIDKMEGVKKKSTSWDQQMYQAKNVVFSFLFDSDKAKEILRNPENDYYIKNRVGIDKWNKKNPMKQLYWILKEYKIIVKGRDYQ